MPVTLACWLIFMKCIYRESGVTLWLNMVQYNMIMHTSLLWLRQNINQGLHSQKTPHNSPSRVSYGMSIVNIFEKTDRVIMTLLCTYTVHYDDVIMGAIASQIPSLTVVYSIVNWDADQRKRRGSASLAFVWGIHRGPVNSLHKWPVTRKMFPYDDFIMSSRIHGI